MKQPIPKVQFDVNVLLDALLDRKPWASAALSLLALSEKKVIEGCWCAASVSTLGYLVQRELGPARARKVLLDLNTILRITPVDAAVIAAALSSNIHDVEDAIVHESARLAGASHLVTRDPKGFRHSALIVCDAGHLLAALS
jgi:predicted nucleic acid-binding protein